MTKEYLIKEKGKTNDHHETFAWSEKYKEIVEFGEELKKEYPDKSFVILIKGFIREKEMIGGKPHFYKKEIFCNERRKPV